MAAGDPGVLKRNFSATAIETTLVNSISSAATGDTTTSVSVVSVSGFPSVPYTLILGPDTNKEEVVTVTAASSTTLTITRGQDGTVAQAHTAGTAVRHGVSGRDFREEQTHIAARGYDADTAILSNAGQTHVHGLQTGDGSVVGSDQSVTLTRKTLTTPVINGATLTGTVSSTASIVVSGAGTITGLSSAGMVDSSAAPKNYVDSILGSATAASTSAASAATSATSAATSATSAATSATSSATSASAAATSASSALTSQTAAATSATSAAASATAAATSATSAATSATSSASSASAAATSASSAATSAGSSETSAIASATSASAAATSASNAATSAASAAASTSAAAASASAAATSATSAAASATAAATSATSAATSASSALTSQTAAATSATSAATSASSAATSAADALTSANSAATTYDNFDDRYLGAKSTPPTVDNDGNALLTGALYFNSVLAAMYVWTGSVWSVMATSGDIESVTAGTGLTGGGASGAVTVSLDTTSAYVVPSQTGENGKFLTTNGSTSSWASVDALPSQTGNAGKYLGTDGSTASWSVVAGSLAQPTEPSSPADGQIWIDTDGTAPTTVVTRWTKQPAAGTTVLTGNDDYSIPLAYSPGYEQVFVNGVLLSRSASDYTATSGTSITLASATVASDIVEVICPLQIATTDTYTQSAVNNAFQANTNNFAAGKNKIINGNFGVWQRGTSFSGLADQVYFADRFVTEWYANGATNVFSRQSFTPGTAPVSGYESTYFARCAVTSGAAGTIVGTSQKIENVQTFAGQTVTVSFWAKADTARAMSLYVVQNFGSGGSTSVTSITSISNNTTSWSRYSITTAIPSISGKTIGTSSYLSIGIIYNGSSSALNSAVLDLWGVQVEAGSVATAFQTATGTIQGELAACQRYYWRVNAHQAYSLLCPNAQTQSSTVGNAYFLPPSTMRVTPTAIDYSNLALRNASGTYYALSSVSIEGSSTPYGVYFYGTISGATANQPGTIYSNNNASAYLGFSAEL
jgi:hypothetical protein